MFRENLTKLHRLEDFGMHCSLHYSLNLQNQCQQVWDNSFHDTNNWTMLVYTLCFTVSRQTSKLFTPSLNGLTISLSLWEVWSHRWQSNRNPVLKVDIHCPHSDLSQLLLRPHSAQPALPGLASLLSLPSPQSPSFPPFPHTFNHHIPSISLGVKNYN